MRNVFANKNIGEMITLVRNAGLILRIFQIQTHVQKHVNLLTRIWIFVHLTKGVNSFTNTHLCQNIGSHMFFTGSRGRSLNTRPSAQTSPEEPGNTAIKQTCVIVILANFTLFHPNSHWKRCSNIKTSLFLHLISLNKMAPTLNFRTSPQRHSRTQRFRE